LGYLPKIEELELPERHLGLVPVSESRELKKYIQKLTVLMEEHIDLESVIENAINIPYGSGMQERLSFSDIHYHSINGAICQG
ncbi:MAG: cobyrinate a,c-diamide synthase, partial [Halanaerobium sp.]